MPRRILVVSPTPTHPAIAGNRARICAVVAGLRQLGHDVHFLHIERESGDSEAMKAAWGGGYHRSPYVIPHRRGRRLVRRLRAWFDPEARYRYGLDDWWDDSAGKTLSALHRQFHFEVVLVEYVFFSKALEYFDRAVLKILDTHDVFSDRHRLYLQQGLQPQWFSTSRRAESRGLDRADVVLAIQEREREFLSTLTAKPVVTVGHIVALAAPTTSETTNILYVGSKNRINVESVERFATLVLPLIRARVPSAVLQVAGGVCDALTDHDAVRKCGKVDDLEDLYRNASVVVNPMAFGTGLKIKNLEALGHARPLVTTSAGAHGLEDGAGKAFLVADEPSDFADAVVRLLVSPELNTAFAQRAHGYASAWNKRVFAAINAAVARSN